MAENENAAAPAQAAEGVAGEPEASQQQQQPEATAPQPEAEAPRQEAAAPEQPEPEPAPPEEITYHAVEKDGQVTALWEMQGRKHLRTIDPRSRQGQEILRLYTAEHGE
jgi:hypothetical protein